MVIGGPDIEGEDEFHKALGNALSSWQLVEAGTYGLFCTFLLGADTRLVSVIFHHIQSFEARITLVDRCAFFILPNRSFKDRWKRLYKKLRDQTKLRNRIVHFAKGYRHTPPEFTGYVIGPSHSDATYLIGEKWKNPEFQFDQQRLQSIARDFEFLGHQVSEFSNELFDMLQKSSHTNRSRSKRSKSSKRSQ